MATTKSYITVVRVMKENEYIENEVKVRMSKMSKN